MLFDWSPRHYCQYVIISTNIFIAFVPVECLCPTTDLLNCLSGAFMANHSEVTGRCPTLLLPVELVLILTIGKLMQSGDRKGPKDLLLKEKKKTELV